jgi:DNA-binding NtrC family response regulator
MADSALIISRDPELREQVRRWESLEEARLLLFDSLDAAYARLTELEPLLLLVDRRSETGSLLGLLRRARRRSRHLEIILLESPRSDRVREAERQAGVDRFIDLPLPDEDLGLLLGRRIRLLRFRRRCRMVGKSESFEQILEMVLQIAPTDISVLITGESGTGKELIAQILHQNSRRARGAFLALNCGALPEGTLESELFGHEKGAFTGASATHAGHFERADGGTLFLDEIGELTPQIQIRLLRVLETGEYIRMGGVRTLRADVRLIAATNRDLELEVREGRFRRDLLHRIKVFEIHVPALRERQEDIPLLVEHFIRELHEKEGTPLYGVDPELLEVLSRAPWPGNARELRNVVQRMGILAKGGKLGLADLPPDFVRSAEAARANLPIPLGLPPEEADRELIYRSLLGLHEDVREALEILRGFQERLADGEEAPAPGRFAAAASGRDVSREGGGASLEDMQRRLIRQSLAEHQGNRRRAARQLGISERTLYRKIKEYGLG